MRTDRREFLYATSLAAIGACAPASAAGALAEHGLLAAPLPIAQVRFDLNRIHKWDDSNGDTWIPSGPTTTSSTLSIATAEALGPSRGTSPSMPSLAPA